MSSYGFFFFKQKTAYEIVSRDWSSDVCSSDLDTGDSDVATFFYFMGLAVTRARGQSDESLPLYTDRKSVV